MKKLFLLFMICTKGFWGKGAIDTTSEQLEKEMPGLRGFSARNLRYMRTFYEEWEMLDRTAVEPVNIEDSDLAHACAKIPLGEADELWNTLVPKFQAFPMEAFKTLGFLS